MKYDKAINTKVITGRSFRKKYNLVLPLCVDYYTKITLIVTLYNLLTFF